MNTLLISQGGCGTNWLKARYGPPSVCAGLPDINPHQRMPYCPDGTRILYLMANPIDQFFSFHRREFFTHNMAVRNLGGNEVAFRHIHPDGMGGGSLEGYAELGINCFQWAEHRKGWQAYALGEDKEIRFVCWEMLKDKSVLHDLDRWVLGNGKPNYYPFSERSPRPDVLSVSQLEKLMNTHIEDIEDHEFVMKNLHAVH